MKGFLTALAIMMVSYSAQAQPKLSYTEYGVGIGTLNYSGEIATTRATSALLAETRPNLSVMLKRHTNDWFAFGLNTSYGWIYASDENHTHQTRGLEMSTSMFQINPFVEVNFLRFGKFHYERKFTFYIKAGLGLLAYNPTPSSAEVYPEHFELRPNGYSSMNYFGGGGLKFRLSYHTILTVEGTFHNAGADDLEGVIDSDPANQRSDDTYGGISVMISRALF